MKNNRLFVFYGHLGRIERLSFHSIKLFKCLQITADTYMDRFHPLQYSPIRWLTTLNHVAAESM